MSAAMEPEYAGQRLGLPPSGPGSVAGWGRRIAALFVDWVGSVLVAAALFGYSQFATAGEQGWVGLSPLLVFITEVTLFTAFAGGSFGQLALRVAVVRLDGRPLTILTALVRTLLICLVIPPVVFNRDGRGLHDLAVNTVTLRR